MAGDNHDAGQGGCGSANKLTPCDIRLLDHLSLRNEHPPKPGNSGNRIFIEDISNVDLYTRGAGRLMPGPLEARRQIGTMPLVRHLGFVTASNQKKPNSEGSDNEI
jgi:hypothetical protein